MSCILNIETSTKICSVALSLNSEIIFNKEDREGASHASLLGLFVSEAVEFARKNKLEIDAVAVSKGPGSYTGLRIGISEAKGLCYGLDIPLIAVSTLELMADIVIKSGLNADYYCPMIDARRMEVYAAIFDKQLNLIREISADIVDGNAYEEFLSKGKVLFFGNGSDKCTEVILSPNAAFVKDINPLASGMYSLSEAAFENKTFEDVAYFEPLYLKEFIATIAKNKVINKQTEK